MRIPQCEQSPEEKHISQRAFVLGPLCLCPRRVEAHAGAVGVQTSALSVCDSRQWLMQLRL